VPESRRHVGYVEREHAVACFRNVVSARKDLRSARDSASGGWNKHGLHAELVAALEGYEAAIIELGAPVPRKLQNELQLHRRLGNHA
jgi:hypothetical protein